MQLIEFDNPDEDRILYQKRLRNELTELRQALAPYQETLQGIL